MTASVAPARTDRMRRQISEPPPVPRCRERITIVTSKSGGTMGLLSRLFGGGGDEDGHEPPSMPWDRRPSILEFVRSHIARDGPGMAEGGDTLPDEDRIGQGSKIRWAAGAMDGVATYHMATGVDEETVRRTVELVVAYSRRPTAANKAAVYHHIVNGHLVSIIDPVIEALVNESGIGHDRLYKLARSFVTEAPDRRVCGGEPRPGRDCDGCCGRNWAGPWVRAAFLPGYRPPGTPALPRGRNGPDRGRAEEPGRQEPEHGRRRTRRLGTSELAEPAVKVDGAGRPVRAQRGRPGADGEGPERGAALPVTWAGGG
jgi:hypothetical protein